MQRVLEPAVNDALRGDRLPRAQPRGFQQQDPVAATPKLVEQPQPRGPAAKNQHINLHRSRLSRRGEPAVRHAGEFSQVRRAVKTRL